MRIVAGRFGGRRLQAPEGEKTRPTSDRMREAIASMVLSEMGLDLGGTSVLDAFAGSGAVGLELLSRGAEHVTFLERDRRARQVIQRNVSELGLGKGDYAIVGGDTFALAERGGLAGAPFDIVFMDPPYAVAPEALTGLVERLLASGDAREGALVVYERAGNAPGLGLQVGREIRVRGHGNTAVELWRLAGEGL